MMKPLALLTALAVAPIPAGAETFATFSEALRYVQAHADQTFETRFGDELAFYPPLDLVWKLDGNEAIDYGVIRDRRDGNWVIEWLNGDPRAFAFDAPPPLTATGRDVPAALVDPVRALDGAVLAAPVGPAPTGTAFAGFFSLAFPEGSEAGTGRWFVYGDRVEIEVDGVAQTFDADMVREVLQ
ncbi:hypothetical protein [Roseobacter sp. HKCCA0434]|uniref:hypothetical protein n=1 Tax=Roseobacter sp. HKCCA0434 TaxID=3079297 RepID=UPI002905CCFF|nr:hypothetical protein [Roseobacter sp. HKCCA0434]